MTIDRLLHVVHRRWRSLFRRSRVEAELAEELDNHVQHLTDELRAGGLDTGRARTEALRRFGGVERHKEACRDARGLNRLDHLWRDLRHAWRSLLARPGFTLVAGTTLALGIGATTAMFTVVEHILLRPLGYREADRLVVLQYERMNTVAAGNFLDFQKEARSFAGMGAAEWWSPNVGGGDAAEEIQGLRLTAGIFPLLGVAPLLGRTFTADETHAGAEHVVVLSHQLWQTRFGGDSTVVGRTISMDGAPFTIIGVMPRGFGFAPYWATGARLWAPLVLDARAADRTGASLRVFARLGDGVSLEAARREVAAIAARLEQAWPGTNRGGTVVPLKELVVGDVRDALQVLFAAVTLVLLIACANVAHLQLLRAAAREREFALRGALGASRSRLLQQSLVESFLLALIGAAGGLFVAWGGLRLLLRLAPGRLPRIDSLSLDLPALGFVLLAALGATIVSGLVPALAASRADLHGVLKEGGRGNSEAPGRRRLRALLVVSEFALALMLLIGAGLVLRSFDARRRLDPGFRPDGVFSAVINLRGSAHQPGERREQFFHDLQQSAGALPGVQGVSMINHLPLHGDSWRLSFVIEGRPLAEPGDGPSAYFRVVMPDYFGTMGIPVLSGRDLTEDDRRSGNQVVIINQSMAERHWPGQNPLGARISVGALATGADWYTVVGVVRDARQTGWTGPVLEEMYFPWLPPAAPGARGGETLAASLHPGTMTLVLRSTRPTAELLREVRGLVTALDRDVSVSDVLTLRDAVDEQFAGPRFQLSLLGGFALLALVLAAVGIYGVMSYTVMRRAQEIGVRLALGAAGGDAVRLVVGQGMRLALAGSAIGLGGSLLLSRYLRSLLFGVGPTDPFTFLGVPLLLAAVALVALAIPARRAARVNPLTALRSD
ncbi:MAG TPA: ABC transporter permease [Gemmatimonadales bacterium]|nr:ABC transporter permease [Gemmatimonadales bacterium]